MINYNTEPNNCPYIEDTETKLAFYINKTALYESHNPNHVNDNRLMLQRSINQFALLNPNFTIILLTDEIDIQYDNCKQYNINEFDYVIDNFDIYYKNNHKSTNPYTYERFCFARWLILKEFINKYFPTIKNVMIMDNDTLIFKNMFDYVHSLTNMDLYISVSGCPAFTIIGKNALYAICDYIEYCFKNCAKVLIKIYNKFGVLSDMTFLNYYCRENIRNYILYIEEHRINIIWNDINKTSIENGFYISNAAMNDLIEYKLINNKLYLLNLYDKYLTNATEKCECAGIHFAGGSKYLLEKYYNILNCSQDE